MNMYDWLQANRVRSGARTAFVTRDRDGERSLTWAELADRVEHVRGGLRDHGVRAADRVALSLPNGSDLVATLLAIVAEGAVTVVLPTPSGRRDAAYAERALGIWDDCAPVLLVEDDEGRSRRAPFGRLADVPATTPAELAVHDAVDDIPRVGADDIAFLQYTSGSTKRPRGVVVTAEMLEANCRQARSAYGDSSDDVAVTWVPLFHDMGLVTGLVRPLFSGYTSVLSPPMEFVSEPLSWLRTISENGATLSSAPDFAFAYCARKLRSDDLSGIDLSGWRVARNAGEMVRATTMDAFVSLTRAAGFRESAFCPSYGMAEATLTVTATTPAERPRRLSVDPGRLAVGDTVVPGSGSHELLSSGGAVAGTMVRAGATGAPEGVVGELHVAGPQVSRAYFRSPMPRATDGALRTGDLGFVLDGHVFVLGRHDDVLVANGVNYFQHDIALACASVPGIRPGRLAAFLDDREPSRSGVVVVAEVRADADAGAMPAAIQRRVYEHVGLLVSRVEVAPPGSLPVTTSGKVRVTAVRADYYDRTIVAQGEGAAR